MQIIKQEISGQLKTNSKAKYRLSYEFDVHTNTINRWIEDNDKGENTPLVTPMGLKAISEELEISRKEILTEA